LRVGSFSEVSALHRALGSLCAQIRRGNFFVQQRSTSLIHSTHICSAASNLLLLISSFLETAAAFAIESAKGVDFAWSHAIHD
jgi:hypothetical protein